MPYTPTVWVNGTTPAINATDLNHLNNELKLQATAQGVANTLPTTWTNGIAPAVSDPVPLNEMERVAQVVGASLSLAAYTPTAWSNGWVPARNAANLNHLEARVQANRIAIDNPPTGTLFDQLTDWGDGYLSSCTAGGETETLENRWAPRLCSGNPAYRFSSPSNVATPYSTLGVPAVQEFATPYGGGFKFLITSQCSQPGSGALVFINDSVGGGAGGHINATEGVTEDWSGKFYFPSSGNANGFEPSFISATLWEFHSTGNSSGHGFGLEPNVPSTAGHRMRFLKQTDTAQHYLQFYTDATSAPPNGFVTFDVWHSWRMVVKWSAGAGGLVQGYYDGHLVMNVSGATMFGDGHNLHFGIYRDDASPSITNEVWHADIRKQ